MGAARRTAVRCGLVMAPVVVLVAALAGCSSSGPAKDSRLTPTPSASPSGPDLSTSSLWLSFEQESIDFDGTTTYPDALDGPFDARVMVSNGGSVEVVPGAGSARAVAFPEKCTARKGCPRALLEVASDPALDPGDAEFEYGASVWLAPDQTTTGSNIVQKGRFGTDGGLWKLQVDSAEGEPSCVVRSGSDLVNVRSSVSIADAAWHHIVCRRDADGVSIEVDGTVDREDGPTGPVASTWPVRIGGPGVGDLDDQFHGRIDDVYLRIGPAS
jgi:hypothetical protein